MMTSLAIVIGLWAADTGQLQTALPEPVRGVGFDQRLNEQIPLDLEFVDETGKTVALRPYFGAKPVILVLVYYECPRLCNVVLNGLVQGMLEMPHEAGRDFNVLTVSFDPRETWRLAASKRQSYLKRYGKPGAQQGWHFLTGDESSIRKLADSVGFHYRFDAASGQFVHAAGIVVLTPSGRISRYFYDVNFKGRDLRLGLTEASGNRIGSPVDQILLYCLHYDATLGRYSASIMNMVRVGGIFSLAGVAGFIWFLRRSSPRIAIRGL
ncbi:MAG TPA: SCO family protein, partial [Planctomycetaceae bacterium]